MGQHNSYGKGHEPVSPGTIVGVGGDIIAQPGEFNFAEGGPRHDETVYVLFETVQPQPHNRKIGETFGVELPVPPGWMFCTGKIPGEGNPNDCMLVYLRGSAAPPKGTRFVMRMLPPVEDERPVARHGGAHYDPVATFFEDVRRARDAGERSVTVDLDVIERVLSTGRALRAKLLSVPEAKAVLDEAPEGGFEGEDGG